jgi:hypothetical protein
MRSQRNLREKARMPSPEERVPSPLRGGHEWPKWLFLLKNPLRKHRVLHSRASGDDTELNPALIFCLSAPEALKVTILLALSWSSSEV